MSNNKDLFTSGQVLRVYKNFQNNNYLKEDFTWILGSLCLLGKIDEANALIKKKKLEVEHFFFLALAAIRISDFQLAKSYINKLKKLKTNNRFFEYQIIALYAYYQSRYKCTLTVVKRSRSESISLENAFWKVLAIDLLGHTHIMMGEVHKGIMLLEEAHDLASLLKNKAFLQATKISILNYQAQYTSDPFAMINKIEKRLKSLDKFDNFSEGSLLLSLVHLSLITGDNNKAEKFLKQSQKVIFANSNPRQKSKWFFENSFYYYLNSKFDKALLNLELAEELININFETSTSLKILGLRRSIYQKLKKSTEKIDERLIQLTLKVGDPQAINKLSRLNLIKEEVTEDPLQLTFDHFFKNGNTTEILDIGFFGLIRPKLNETDKCYILKGIWRNGLIIITPFQVIVKKNGVSELLQKALILIATRKRISKEELVFKIWGYSYDPIRHDTLIYGLIHRLREVLGPLEKDLHGEDHHYYFGHSFKELELSNLNLNTHLELINSDEFLQEDFQKLPNWNIRQHRALVLMSQGSSFKVSEYAEQFKVTTMTALRDLKELERAKKIKVYGKGRATTYAL